MPPKKPATTKTAAKPATKGGAAKGAGAAKPKPKPVAEAPKGPPLPEVKLEGKKIIPLLTNSADEIRKKYERWPYIVDSTGVVQRLLRYSDVNVLEVMTSDDMDPERIRKALLGSLRYGKPLVFDMGDMDMTSSIEQFLDRIQPDLTKLILTKKVLEEECIEKLIKTTDEEDYQNCIFYKQDGFSFSVITVKEEVSDETKSKMFVVRVE
ncbi:IQ motif and ankyrin repeat domain-containing protein 1-like [Ylistrum balloti]|uniref:IQ motif and ankyrin repeat domain-containing protein 1-like n=1 Tax=Ylistrum balloti TaxID=509963 RepID=UPI0029058E7A|nr:IQ motif and ankyrin repeat domain-containing protein 1-like [Ylistrum balloti]